MNKLSLTVLGISVSESQNSRVGVVKPVLFGCFLF